MALTKGSYEDKTYVRTGSQLRFEKTRTLTEHSIHSADPETCRAAYAVFGISLENFLLFKVAKVLTWTAGRFKKEVALPFCPPRGSLGVGQVSVMW